jgi:hypothetical protein
MWRREIKEATWEQFNQLYKANPKTITFSSQDHPEKIGCYFHEQIIPANDVTHTDVAPLTFIPINFLSYYTISTHKGTVQVFWVEKIAFKNLIRVGKPQYCNLF